MSDDAFASVLAAYAGSLAAAGVPSPDNDVELLAMHVLEVGRSTIRRGDARPTEDQLARLGELVGARARRVPLQHLTGEAHFRNLTLTARPGVFVPRPETEVLVDLARACIADLRRDDPARELTVVEPCTGTGAIALALASEVGGLRVIATELSEDALALAKHNAEATSLAEGSAVTIVGGDLLDPVDAGLRGHVDLLVSNPPYLADADLAGLDPEVVDHDPREALVGGHDGYEVVQRLCRAASAWLRSGGHLVLEIADHRGDDAAAVASHAGLADVTIHPDLTRRDRFVVARQPHPATGRTGADEEERA